MEQSPYEKWRYLEITPRIFQRFTWCFLIGLNHRLSINRPTKRGKENFLSDEHCQCEKDG
jgi:hypothetical protein